jgi:biotin carboxylase
MREIAARAVLKLGLDATMFNVEMFHDPATDGIAIVEVNPRMAYQFADLYEKVDGTNLYELQLALALGREPRFRRGAGPCRAATSFVLRRFQDARVRRVPSESELAALRRRVPDARVHVLARVGRRLSRQVQDPHSFRYGIVNLGGPSREALLETYEVLCRELAFEFG